MEASMNGANGHLPLEESNDEILDAVRRRLRLVGDDETESDPSDRALMDLHAASLRLRSAARKLSRLDNEVPDGAYLPSRDAVSRARRAIAEAVEVMPDSGEQRILRFGSLEIVPGARTAHFDQRAVHMSVKEFDLLCYLAQDPYAVWKKTDILKEVWGFLAEPKTRTVDSHASRIRRAIVKAGAAPGVFIHNYWGTGYSLLRER